jgi:hypothetical protein
VAFGFSVRGLVVDVTKWFALGGTLISGVLLALMLMALVVS